MSRLWRPYCGQSTYERLDIFFFLFTKCLKLFILCIHAEANYLTWINLVIYSSYFFSSHPVVADVIFTLYLKVAHIHLTFRVLLWSLRVNFFLTNTTRTCCFATFFIHDTQKQYILSIFKTNADSSQSKWVCPMPSL